MTFIELDDYPGWEWALPLPDHDRAAPASPLPGVPGTGEAS